RDVERPRARAGPEGAGAGVSEDHADLASVGLSPLHKVFTRCNMSNKTNPTALLTLAGALSIAVTVVAHAGDTVPSPERPGTSTHLLGIGFVEMLGWQLRLELLARADQDRKGWIRKGEADNVRAIVENLPLGVAGERVSVDFGTYGDHDGDGRPDLNSVCFIY